MNIKEIRETSLAKPAVTEGCPFGQDVLMFKVMNKIIMNLSYTVNCSMVK